MTSKQHLYRLVVALLAVMLLIPASFSAAQDEPLTIGVTVPTLDAQFWNQYVNFVEEGAAALGMEVVVLNADNSPDEMASNIEDLIARGVDGMIHVPYWNTGIKALMEASASNTPVIMTDVYLEDIDPQSSDFPNYLAFVGPSDEEAGYAMANALFEEMRARGMDMVVGVVDGTPGTSVAIDRRKGFDRALAENEDVTLAGAVTGNFVRDESQEAFAALYQGNPEIKGVWAANGGTATGVMAALMNADQVPGEDVLVVGMDLNPENVDAVENGDLLFDIGGHWLQGGFALVMMHDYLNGLEVPADQANVKLDLLPLTQDLVAQFRADFPDGVPAYNWEERSRVYTPDAPPAAFELQYSGSDEEASAEPMAPLSEAYTIGVTVPTLDAQFWNQYVNFVEEGAAVLGLEVVVLNADNSPDEMASNIEDLIARGVDGMIHVPYWNTGIKALMEASASNTPVIMTDVYLEDIDPQSSDFPNYLAFVGPSDEEAGYAMANALFEEMRARGMDMVVGVVDGTPGTSVAIDRRKGFDRALAENEDVTLAGAVTGNFVRDESQEAFAALYQGNPEIKGVWAANGGTATGVMAALMNADQVPGEDVLVVGMDLNPENVDAVENGDLLFDIGGHWLQGGFALVMMHDYLNGLEVPADQANVKLDLLPLTQDLVAQFRADFPGGVPEYDWQQRSRLYNPDAPPAVFELQYSE